MQASVQLILVTDQPTVMMIAQQLAERAAGKLIKL